MGRGGSPPGAGEPRLRRAVRRIGGIQPVIADTLLALVLTVPLLIDLHRYSAPGPPMPFRDADPAGYVLVALLILPLALRRVVPMTVFCVILTASVLTVLVGYRPDSYGFGLIIAIYTVARWCDPRRSLIALVVGLAFTVFVKARFLVAGVEIELFAWPLDAAYVLGAWFLGHSIRTGAQQSDELRRSRDALARQAVEREHLRIARELHDSVGHSLSVMVLYAGAAERVAHIDPERSRDLLETVTETGRAALAEMDDLVRVLRDEAPSAVGVQRLDALADEFRGLGLPVAVTVTGRPCALPEPLDRCAFRVAQEALTNTLKHADARSAQVQLRYAPDVLTVTVADDGSGCTDLDLEHTERHGLTGMHERVTALGGELRLGSRPDGAGFRVEARLPLLEGVGP